MDHLEISKNTRVRGLMEHINQSENWVWRKNGELSHTRLLGRS